MSTSTDNHPTPPPGFSAATWQFVCSHRTPEADVTRLMLSASRHPQVDMHQAAGQIAGWQAARRKLPAWAATEGMLYPPHLALEQCSGEPAARYKARLARRLLEQAAQAEGADGTEGSGTLLVDLTGGFGVDFSYMARTAGRAVYVERQETLCRCARHNFPLLGLGENVQVVCAQAEDYLEAMPATADLIYLDPARRDAAGSRVSALHDCTPDCIGLLPLLRRKTRRCLLKLAPMLDLSEALRAFEGMVQEAHVVAAGGECKELLLALNTRPAPDEKLPATDDVPLTAVDLRSGTPPRFFRFTRREEQASSCTCTPPRPGTDTFLYEPGSALLKAGALRLPAARWGLRKISPDSHLYLGSERIEDFPGRCFRLDDCGGMSKAELKRLLAGATKGNLTVRGFPATVAELRRKLRLKEGGDLYFFAATTPDGSRILLRCHKPDEE